MDKLQVIRPLSEIESFYVTAKVSVLTVSHLEGTLSHQSLQNALNKTAKRHPFLSCKIINNTLIYSPQKNITLKILKNKKPHEIIEKELNTALPHEKYLFRAVLIENDDFSTLIITLHHAIADGICSTELHKEILALTDNPSLSFDSLKPMPPIEDFFPTSITPEDLNDFIKRYTEKAETTNAKSILPNTIENSAPHLKFIQRKLNQTQTLGLLEKCKTHQTTLHGLITAAHLLAIKQILDPVNNLTLCCHSPMNIRSRLEPSIEKYEMLSAAIGCSSCHQISNKTSLWNLSIETTQNIKTNIENNDIFKSLLTFKETRAKFKLPIAIGITNLGVINLSHNYNNFTLKEIYFIPAIHIPMLTATVVTYNNELTINYPYLEPYYSSSLIHQIANYAFSYLDLN